MRDELRTSDWVLETFDTIFLIKIKQRKVVLVYNPR